AGQLLGTGMNLTVAPGASQTITLTVSDQCGQAEVTTIDLVVGYPANAGTNGVLVTCSSGAPADLFGELGGTPDTGGTWSGPSTIANGQFDPGVHAAGTYTYSVPGEVPCPVQSATVAVTVVAAPDAGGNGYIALCATDGATGLINSLEGNPDGGGTWTGPSSINGLFNPALHEPGTYTYTVTAPAPCPSASATVEVEVSIPANAGTDGSAVLCSNGPATALIGMLGGAPQGGGTWSGPGPVPGGSFNPATGTPGLYTYTVQSPAPCPAATATVNMTVQAAPQPGSGQTLALCANQPPVDLFAELNGSPDQGGTWTGPLGVMNGSFNPALGPAGTYTYTVAGVAPCANASTSHTVTVTPAPNAGGSTAILLCPEAAPTDLFDHLAGAPASGGTWTGPGGGGNGTFSPGTDQPGVYTYTVTTGPACPPATATVTVTVPALTPAYAGPDAVICDLSGNLAASDNWASGTWTAPPGIDLADIHSPASGITAEQGGAYTLVWSTVSPDGCTDSDEVQVVLTPPMSATVTTEPASCHGLCNGQAQVQAQGGNLDGQGYGHAWSGGTGNAAQAMNICPGEHQVVVTDMNGCAVIVPFTIEQPDPVAIDSIAVQRVTCAGDCDGTLVVTAPHGEAYSLNGGQTWQDAPEFTGLCAGTWTVTVRDEAGCTATVNGQVASPPPTIAAFHWSPHVIYANAPAVQFMNVSSSDAVAFAWDFAGLGTSMEASPVFHFPGILGGTYPVCLQVTNADGCTDLHCREVEVRDVPMGYLPNAFTPDADGLNDHFGPVFSTLDIMDYEFLVFDRWSRVAFESTDPLDRWDGTMDGKLVSTGTYVWILRYRADRQSDRVEMRGHVTVVR
ncbi:MAG: gliding motility-associated C-terminal domain-containing protein, partial [Flavobacteriales bacterium]|nr:gliding motility-associated C-terminal domain-containing protein [Flavobacteriales bacterium]